LDTLHIQIDPTFLTSTWFMTVIASLLLVCILLSGSYPTFILSRYMPVDVLKGKPGATGGGGWVRKGLIVFQFTASIALILITLGIHHQLNFLRNQKIGLHKEQVMVVTLDARAAITYSSLKNELKNLTGVLQVASASNPLYTTGQSALFTKTPRTKEDVFIYTMTIDENFFSTLEIEWVNRPQSMATRGYIINEAALEDLKISHDDIGMNLEMNETLPITGIVRNFNYTSLRDKIKGLVFTVASDTDRAFVNNGVSLYIRLDPAAKILDKTAAIKTVFKKYQKDQPFEYYFLDEAFQQLYSSEDRLSTIFYAFTAIALFIASLGLFGLITFATEVRTKEISIRKVLGARIRTILVLLSKDFTLLVFIAVGLAIPFAAWYTQHWLTQFSYRVEIPWWYSLLAALAAVVISVIITSMQGIKVALTNPAETLRSE
jgi:putative ABC transport system permease protein